MKQIFLPIIAILLVNTFFISCKDDEEILNSVEVTNSELKSALEQKGFTFNNAGELVQDKLVQNTTSLDLSGSGLIDVSGLEIFPHLTEVDLSNNDFSITFDFSQLPSTITSVDLTDNKIYEFTGLVDVETEENGDETVTLLRSLTKLNLPVSARFDCNELVYFYEQNQTDIESGTVVMQMDDANNILSDYTTLREVPDKNLLAFLQENFPSMFDGSSINIANRITNASELTNNVIIQTAQYEIEDLEGVQYIAMCRSYEATYLNLIAREQLDIEYIKIKPCIINLGLHMVDCYVNYSDAETLCQVSLLYSNTAETIDLSTSTYFGQRGANAEMTGSAYSFITAYGSKNLKTITISEDAKYIKECALYNLPSLEEVDFSSLSGAKKIQLANLPALESVTYFTPDDNNYYTSTDKYLRFDIGTDIYEFESTRTFIQTYHKHLHQGRLSSSKTGIEQYDWEADYE